MQLQALFNWTYTKIANFIPSFLHEKQNNKQTSWNTRNEYLLYIHILYTSKYLPVLFSPISPASPMGSFKGRGPGINSSHSIFENIWF